MNGRKGQQMKRIYEFINWQSKVVHKGKLLKSREKSQKKQTIYKWGRGISTVGLIVCRSTMCLTDLGSACV